MFCRPAPSSVRPAKRNESSIGERTDESILARHGTRFSSLWLRDSSAAAGRGLQRRLRHGEFLQLLQRQVAGGDGRSAQEHRSAKATVDAQSRVVMKPITIARDHGAFVEVGSGIE